MMVDCIQVMTTTENRTHAERIAEVLVEKQLAACVQIIGPISSIYRWRGRVEKTREWLCLLKTTKAAYPRIETVIKEIHPYETPEIVVVPIVAGSRDYLDWLTGQVDLKKG